MPEILRSPRRIVLVLASLLLPQSAWAQNEAALRAAFEGKLVSVKVAMPGTARGIDVFPQQAQQVNWRQVADRIKEDGTALKIGDQVMITKIVVKGESHIEFQLGGGGFGTFGDSPGSSRVSADVQSETAREKELKEAIKNAPGPTRRKELERELASVRGARERENDKARAQAEQANAAREANLRAKREQSGSRFNVRYKAGIPPASLTPDGLMAVLAPYVDFAASGSKTATAQAVLPTAPAPTTATGEGALAQLKKGLSVREVEALLGPADSANEEQQGSLTVNKRTYSSGGMKVVAAFINGVMIDFSITPR
jgi:hypothetical protein